MAGFFGLFNYEKEGPGISKNAPKKKSFIVFFETFFRNFWKFIPINIVYSIMSVPAFTVGLSSAGITNVTRNIARDKHSFGLSDYFETIKKNWKQALGAGFINLLVYIVLIFDIYFFYTGGEGILLTIGLGLVLAMLMIFLMMDFYIWTLMITFNFKLKQIYMNSFKFVIINFKNNILCGLILLLVYAIYIAIAFISRGYIVVVLSFEILIYLMTFPAFRALLVQFFTFPSIKKIIIDPYYAEHPEDDIQKRLDLGLEVEETKPVTPEGEEEEPENVFDDNIIIE